METARIGITYRPLRLAWAVHEGDFAGLRRAMRNSFALWGGRTFPILVIERKAEAEKIVADYCVDVICPIKSTNEATAFVAAFPHLSSPFHNDPVFDGSGGVAVLDLRNLIKYRRTRVGERNREWTYTIVEWDHDDPQADAMLSHFGQYPLPDEAGFDYLKFLRSAVNTRTQTIPSGDPWPATSDNPTISSFCALGLRAPRHLPGNFETGLFMGEASNFDDLVTHWNLRARGVDLLFVDRRAIARYRLLIPLWMQRPEGRRLVSTPEESQKIPVYSRGDRHADAALIGPHAFGMQIDLVRDPSLPLYLGETSTLGVIGDYEGTPRVSFAFTDKPFSDEIGLRSQVVVATITCPAALAVDSPHTFLPPHVPQLNRVLGRQMAWDHDRFRSEPTGVGLITHVSQTDGFLVAVPFVDLFRHLFSLAGYNAKLSSAGLIARQVIARLGGLQGARPFKIPGVRRLLKAYGPTQAFSKRTALHTIGQPDPNLPGPGFSAHIDLHIEPTKHAHRLTPDEVLGYLVQHGILRMGTQLSCPTCQMASWVPLDTYRHELTCEMCGTTHDASRRLLNSEWHLRRSGVMGTQDHAQGVVPVVLTLQQLDINLSGAFGCDAYVPSMDLVPHPGASGPACEIDFAWLQRPFQFGATRGELLLGECKDGKEIDQSTIDRLRNLADRIPEKYFDVFIILVKLTPFTSQEVAGARTLNEGRHLPRVIMLTARELEPYHLLERTKLEFRIDEHARTPLDLARVTSRIYFPSSRWT